MNLPQSPPRRHWIPWYVGVLIAATGVVLAFASPQPIADEPLLFAALFGFVLLLEFASIDMFGNGSSSPSSIPTVAVIVLFGTFGAIAIVAAPMIFAFASRKPFIKVAFDFGCLAVSGAAASAVISLVPTDETIQLLGAVALAGLVYMTTNNLLILFVWHLDEGKSIRSLFKERLAWMWPYDVACGAMAGLLVLTEQELGLLALAVFAAPMVLIWLGEKNQIENSRRIVEDLRHANDELEGANRQLQGLLDDNRELLAQTHRSYLSTITSLARTIEAKDPYTGGHTERVADIAVALAVELGFDEEQLRAVGVGAIIHDIGKIGIPDAILLKPGRLSEDEFAEMRKHPEISSYILGELELPTIVKQMARHHHERYDGTGYPDGLAGDQIPMAARILTVADAYDAMTSDRPYRDALPEQTARLEIATGAGTQFCPIVAATLMRVLDEGRVPATLSAATLPALESAPG